MAEREGYRLLRCSAAISGLSLPVPAQSAVKWFTEFGHLNRGDMLTSEQHRCHNEKKKFQRRV
ncbi:hypothetical protein CRX67_10500 [Enterobacteriaceae bacterium A-F18]|nr:hypothetical protein CRX67_10500 [Enterobacteriaceae bacterium A-F18]